MKNMNFDLDIIFIENNKIVEIATLKKPSKNNTPFYTSQNKADKVLEINAGLAKEKGIQIGNKILF